MFYKPKTSPIKSIKNRTKKYNNIPSLIKINDPKYFF